MFAIGLIGPLLRRVWDLETGECRQTLEGHSSAVNSVGITPDGRTAISGSTDKTVRCGVRCVWSVCGESIVVCVRVYRVVLVFVDCVG